MREKPFGEFILDLGIKQLGVPYVWGGASPAGFDCSGLAMWLYGQVAGISIPHNDEAQWRWWGTRPDLATRFSAQDISGPEDLRPGDYIWTQFEGGPGNGHEMIFVGSRDKNSPAYSPYANPAWAYTYLQAPSSGDVVRLSEFVWGRMDTAHGGARGLRFGRFARLKYPPGMTPVMIGIEEVVQMGMEQWELKAGNMEKKTSGFILGKRKAKTYLDLINNSTTPMNVEITIQRPNGDFGKKKLVVPVSTGDTATVKKSQGMKTLEVGELFADPNLGNIIIWILVDQPATVVKTQEFV